MSETVMPSWDRSNMHRIFDSVLIRSATEFRRALQLLRRYDVAGGSEYVEHMREGLHAMEAELARRGIEVDGIAEAKCTADGMDCIEMMGKTRPHERSPIPPPRTRRSRASA